MNEQAKISAVIVEDMPEVRAGLRTLVEKHCPQVAITGEAESVVSGAKLIRSARPDLVFLDIEMPDGSGFDLLDIIDEPVQIIFTTAIDSYAARAFRYAAVDYLLKPVDPEQLMAAVERARQTGPLRKHQVEIMSEVMRGGRLDRIALHTQDRIHIVDVSTIIRCEADGNYTRFFISNKSPILVSRTLKDFDQLLSEAAFLRVHQSHLVNVKHVGEYVKTDGVYLVMKDGTKVPVSVRKRHEVLQRLDQLRPA